jgi:hypothetical protein
VQAGATISAEYFMNPSSPFLGFLQEYSLILHKDARKVLDMRPVDLSWDYKNNTAFNAWEISFQLVQKRSTLAAELLLLSAFFDKGELPLHIFEFWTKRKLTG